MEVPRLEQFPKYDDGDVSIVISSARFYQLHSSVLKRNSPYFERELQIPGARLTSKARQEGLASYRFELITHEPIDIGYFERKEVTDSGRVPRSIFSNHLSSLDPNQANETKCQYWDWLFGCFYGIQPNFTDHNLATVLSDCMGLVDVAESIGSVDRVREIVDLALLRQDTVLWTSIATNPTAWTELGRRIHSPTIFTEGVVHLVGTWTRIPAETKADMNDAVRALVAHKHAQLENSKEAVEMRILGHYPPFLTKRASDKPGRPQYANDIYMWMALSFFRHWFAQAISEDRTRRADDGGFAFYTALWRGGQAYLCHEDFEQFWKFFPMSGKACNVLEANMGGIKEDVKRFVEQLVVKRVRCEVLGGDAESGDGSGNGVKVDYLTCAVVGKADCPWVVSEEEADGEAMELLFGGENTREENGVEDGVFEKGNAVDRGAEVNGDGEGQDQDQDLEMDETINEGLSRMLQGPR